MPQSIPIRVSIPIRGRSLAVALFEPSERKSEVILIHGFTGSKEDFDEVGILMAAAGFRVLTFDLRGQHESEHAIDPGMYSMESLGRDVIELSEHLSFTEPHLLGHSFGGLITQQAALLSPQTWASITFMCSGPGGQIDHIDDPEFENLSNDTKAENWERFRAEKYADDPRLELLRKRWMESDATATLIFNERLRNQESLIPQLANFGIPAHVIYGEDDNAWPIHERNRMAEELNAVLTVLPNCGHCPNEEDPELLVQELVRFWNSC